MTEGGKSPEAASRFKRTSAIVGLVGGVIGVILGSWKITSEVQDARARSAQIAIHLTVGDRFATQFQHEQAIAEYQKALAVERGNVEAQRRIIASTREQLLVSAFASGPIDFALRGDHTDFQYVSDSAIDEALRMLYELQARHPRLRDDVALLQDEALILKTDGGRTRRAISVLEHARSLSPENAAVLTELGLFHAVVSDDQDANARGIELIRRAVELQPDSARHHFYLARSLDEARCTFEAVRTADSGAAAACAESIRSYHRAADLATADDVWSWRIRRRAPESALDVFRIYSRTGVGLLSDNLDMPLAERISELEYVLAMEPSGRSSGGPHDNPQYWLAALYHATGDLDGAARQIRELFEERPSLRGPLEWLELYARILEESGQSGEELTWVQMAIDRAKRSSGS